MLATLLAPLDYIRVKHPLKSVVDRWFVIGAASIAVISTLALPRLNVFGQAGLLPGINSLLQILTGFFITSLAAVATFNGSVYRIDDLFEGDVALLDGDALTRRQFLAHLFAYVALLSVVLYFAGAISLAVATSYHNLWLPTTRMAARLIFLGFYMAGVGHVIGTTLIGLVFLSSRFTRISKRDRHHVRLKASTENASGVK